MNEQQVLLEKSLNDEFNINMSSIKDAGKKIGKIIKKDGLNKKSRDEIRITLDELYQSIADNFEINGDYPKSLKSFSKEKVIASIKLTLGCVILNTIVLYAFSIIFGGLAGQLISVGIIVPTIEENAKHVAAKGGFEKEFQVVFNLREFGGYTMMLGGATNSIGKLAVARGAAVAMHITNGVIHWLSTNPKVMKALGIDKDDKSGKAKLSATARIITYFIHMSWNITSVLRVGPIAKLGAWAMS